MRDVNPGCAAGRRPWATLYYAFGVLIEPMFGTTEWLPSITEYQSSDHVIPRLFARHGVAGALAGDAGDVEGFGGGSGGAVHPGGAAEAAGAGGGAGFGEPLLVDFVRFGCVDEDVAVVIVGVGELDRTFLMPAVHAAD